MKNSTKMALGFLALSTVLGGAAMADMKYKGGHSMGGGHGGMMGRLDQADADKNGEITLEEFTKAAGDRFTLADADKDGRVTVEEMAAAIEKMRAERMAQRMVDRFDADDDGAVTLAEMQTSQKEIYAVMDRNDDGKLAGDELKRKGKGHMGRHSGDDGE